MKKRPSGFIAECQCGIIIGAMDFNRTERSNAGKILGRWLFDGCKVTPKFDSSWQATVNTCQCKTTKPEVVNDGKQL